MDKTPLERAVAEWRQSHPEDGDLPDEVVESLTFVRMRAAGIAMSDLGRVFSLSFTDALRRLGLVAMPSDPNPMPRFRLFGRRK